MGSRLALMLSWLSASTEHRQGSDQSRMREERRWRVKPWKMEGVCEHGAEYVLRTCHHFYVKRRASSSHCCRDRVQCASSAVVIVLTQLQACAQIGGKVSEAVTRRLPRSARLDTLCNAHARAGVWSILAAHDTRAHKRGAGWSRLHPRKVHLALVLSLPSHR